MHMALESKNYELAYLLSPSILEEEVLTLTGELSTLVESAKGLIRHNEAPKKIKLFYSIKKEDNAYFGWITFNFTGDDIESLNKKLKGISQILRYLLVEEEIEKRPAFIRPFMPLKTVPRKVRAVPRPEVETVEKLDLEALDKKLEEILGK